MRHQQLNALFLLLALAGLGFGIFGFLQGEPASAARAAVIVETDSSEETEIVGSLEVEDSGDDSPDQPRQITTPKPQVQPAAPPSETIEEAPELPDWQGRIFGRVVDQDGAPLAKLSVSALDHDVLRENRPDWDTDTAEIEASLKAQIQNIHLAVRRAETDADGRFELTRLNPDAHYEVSANGHERGSQNYWNVACGTELLIILDSSSTVTLKLSDPEGQPINKARIRRFGRSYSSSSTKDGRDGTYYIRWSEDYESVSVGAEGFISRPDITVEDVGETLEVTLQRAPVISGVVTGREGKPLEDAEVRVTKGFDMQGAEIDMDRLHWDNEVETDTTGRYRIDWLPHGRYELTYGIGNNSEAAVKREVTLETDTELDVQVDTGAHLTVRVTDENGKAITRFRTSTRDENQNWIGYEALPVVKVGERRLIALPKTKFQLTITSRPYAPYVAEVDTTGGDVELDVVLTPGASVKGRILDTQGKPLDGMRLRWTQTGKDPGAQRDIWKYPDDDGSYSVGPLDPGAWIVDIYMNQRLADKVGSQTLQLAAGETVHDLILESPRTLDLQLTLPEGKLLDWVDVYVRKEGETDSMRFYLNTDSGETGVAVPFLPEGDYFIYAAAEAYASSQYKVTLQAGVTACNLVLSAPDCLRITSVADNSNAKLAGLKEGDLILEYDYQKISNLNDLVGLTKGADGRAEVIVKIQRDGTAFEATLKGGLLGINAEPAKR